MRPWNIGLALAASFAMGCGHPRTVAGRTGATQRAACRFYVHVDGKFGTQARWLVNLTNAPEGASASQPPDLPIAPSTIDLLNRDGKGAITGALGERGQVCEGRPPAGSDADEIAVQIGGFDEVGGHYGGLDLVFHVTSPAVPLAKGDALVAVDLSAGPPLDAVRRAALDGLDQALASFDEERKAAEAAPRARFRLVMDVANLDDAQARAADQLVPCLLDEMRTVASRPAGDHAWDVEVLLGERPEDEHLRGFAQTIEASAIANGKARCSLWHTPLQGMRARAEVDVVGHTITVHWGPAR